jgi:LPXTG-motif cell wall-anchored protein
MRRAVAAVSALTLAFASTALTAYADDQVPVAFATVTGHASSTAASNQASYWDDYLDDGGPACYKIPEDDKPSDEDSKIDGQLTYVLPSDFRLVVVKSANDAALQGPYSNTLFADAEAGETVWADTNGNGMQVRQPDDGDKEISHIIFCPAPEDATLTLVKIVEGNDEAGGTAKPGDWTLKADGPGSNDFQGTTGVSKTVPAGDYVLSEFDGPEGYEADDWTCEYNTPVENDVTVAAVVAGPPVKGDTVTVESGDDITCTITNTAIPPQLKLVKVVKGEGDVADWTLTATPTQGDPVDYKTPFAFETVTAGTWTLSENGPGGYEASAWSCDGGTLEDDEVTLALADKVTCTITNTLIPKEPEPAISIVKAVSRGDEPFTKADDFFDRASTQAGVSAWYRFEVTNDGNVSVSDLVLTDDMYVAQQASGPVTSSVLDEGDIDNCTVGTDGGNLTTGGTPFEFGQPITGLTLGVGESVFLFCELPIPPGTTLGEGGLIFNQAFVSGSAEGGPVQDDSNITVLALTPGIIKFIVDEDGSNPVTFVAKAKSTSATEVYFDLLVDNKTGDDRYFTVYDYFDDESLGLTEQERDGIFDSLVCLDFDDPSVYGDAYPTAADYAGQAGSGDILTFGPVDTTFQAGQNATAEAGTYYARAHYLGFIANGDGFQITCQLTLPPGDYELTNIFRMVADLEPPAFEVTDPIDPGPVEALAEIAGLQLVEAVSAYVVNLAGLLLQDTTTEAVTGDVDVAAAAGVTVGEPVEPGPEPKPEPKPEPEPVAHETLPETGADAGQLGLLAAALTGAGALAYWFSRRRNDLTV